MPTDITMPEPTFHAVIDTNVLLEIYSCHDVVGTFDAAHRRLDNAAVDERGMVYRRARARESALLAMYLHRIGATTFSLHNEAVQLLTRRAPPSDGNRTLESAFTAAFVHFVRDHVLTGWNNVAPTEPGAEAGNIADRTLITFAQERGLPLITNEGYTQNGIVDQGMRLLARQANVQVFTPREFWLGKTVENDEIEDFLRRFREQAPRYLEARNTADRTREFLAWMVGYYRHVLLGEVEGRETRAQVVLD